MEIVNMETLPVDRHVWYDGDIVIRDEYRGGAEDAVECGFSDLSEESKETVKKPHYRNGQRIFKYQSYRSAV